MFDWETIGKIANVLQIYDVSLDATQASNDDIMKMLLAQNNDYLQKIVQQNDVIIAILKGGKNCADH